MIQIHEEQFECELSDIIAELQNQLFRHGINLLQKTINTSTHIMVQCPYHKDGQERKPSAGIRKKDGLFHCFTCGEVHDLPEVISYCFDREDMGVNGWRWLLKNFQSFEVEERKYVDLDFARDSNTRSSNKLSVRNSDNSGADYISDKELEKYRYTHPYLYERGMTDEIIELFDLGYDTATKTITFPIKDADGNCLYIARRSVSVKWYNYPKGVEKPLYGLWELKSTHKKPKELIVCEGMFDCLTCWVYGKCAVALNGLGSDLQLKQLRELPVRKLILALDNDKHGQQAKERIRYKVKNKLITEYEIPNGKKDINELTKDEFDEMLEIF